MGLAIAVFLPLWNYLYGLGSSSRPGIEQVLHRYVG